MHRITIALTTMFLLVPAWAANVGEEKIGTPAPEFALHQWINSSPLEIDQLKGKVVLVRWWTDTCPLCAATAPALRQLEAKYGDKGLVVIGVFHPKPAGDANLERVRRAAEKYQFRFPVALDANWTALRRWWLDGAQRKYTSVSFIVDKQGIIRYVHPGGQYHLAADNSPLQTMCERDFHRIESTIETLLQEP